MSDESDFYTTQATQAARFINGPPGKFYHFEKQADQYLKWMDMDEVVGKGAWISAANSAAYIIQEQRDEIYRLRASIAARREAGE